MTTCELRERGPDVRRYAAKPPIVQSLKADAERFAHSSATNLVEQGCVGVNGISHANGISTVRLHCKRQSLIGLTETVMHKARVAKTGNRDPEFGKRLRAMITADRSWRSLRDFALNGMGWPEDSAGQRLDNYLRGRIPDLDTLIRMARVLGTTAPELLGQGAPSQSEEDGSRGILVQLLELAGIDPASADTIASSFLAAQQLYRTIPGDEAPDALAKFSAHAAWLQRQMPAQDT